MHHIEFLHRTHFEKDYFRVPAKPSLQQYISFFWETDFDELFKQYPEGFRDILFPDVGYTYLINLGTPFVMQLNEDFHEIRSEGFLPRHKNITCHHSTGNKIFGIKFRVSPVVFERKLDFSVVSQFEFHA